MPRIASIWLPSWPIARLIAAERKAAARSASSAEGRRPPCDPARPLILVAPAQGGPRITALNRSARENGLAVGELLSNARSKVAAVEVRPADPAADTEALASLGLWAQRYTPLAMAWDADAGADGLFLEIGTSAHLFGGEGALIADLAARLSRFGLAARLAVADTPGASWAVARHCNAGVAIVPSGGERAALRPLPLAALRLGPEALLLARRLGLRRVGDVLDQPRAPLAARFGSAFLTRLDQALGSVPEPFVPLVAPAVYAAQGMLLDPIFSEAHVVEAARRLLVSLSADLARDGMGARRLRVLLFRVMAKSALGDSGALTLDIGLAAPSRDPDHIAALIALKLGQRAEGLDGEFGYEGVGLHVLDAEPISERQAALSASGAQSAERDFVHLVDRLTQRLGPGAVRWLAPYASHIPERATRFRPAEAGPAAAWREPSAVSAGRPLMMLARPEAAEVLALVPEGPPRQFRWRGMLHQVAHSEGPERIAPEWWRLGEASLERDYYAVEDERGRRFWLYRDGRYGEPGITPRWFVHGVFA